MLGEQKRTVKEFFVYWRGLLKEAIATSGRFSSAAKKISTILISGGVLSLIGIKSGFTPSQWLWYPAGAMLLVIFFFMNISAFNMHRKQEAQIKGLEDAMSVKLSVERI